MNRLRMVLALAVAVASPLTAQTAGRAPEKPPRQVTNTYGTTAESYYRLAASDFTPIYSSFSYSDTWFDGNNILNRFSTTGSPGSEFVASPHLPSGAILTYFELDSCDFNPTQNVQANLHNCGYTGQCTGDSPALGSNNNVVPNACSYTSVDLSDYEPVVVNNYGGQILVTVTTQAHNSTTALSGVVIGYKLQVAPAPMTATFDDVPRGYPYFQFIEALSKWGITSGCSTNPPDYCPERPITRGEMAVYMAKALGLYLPQY